MTDTAIEDVQETVEDVGGEDGAGNGGLAKKLLVPAAAGAGTLAATVAARKAPDLFRDHVLPRLEQRGGEEAAKVGKHAARNLQDQGGALGAAAGKVREKLGGAGGREKTRRLPIQRWTDIALPVPDVYERWTQFEEFPKFMHRVVSIEEKDQDHVAWEEKIWFSKRRCEGEITERRKNDRIVWKTTQGTSHSGVVSFHKLDTNLTRVFVDMDFRPSGMIEKMASGMRFVKRAVEADLARFKAYCEFGDAKGLEYEQPRENQGEEAQEGDDAKESRSNGSANPEEREQSRKERAERREERRS
jgi:uncharacterized membrane protein